METSKPWSSERLANTSQQRLMLMEHIASLELQVANKKRQLAMFDDEIATNFFYGKTDSPIDYIPSPEPPRMSEIVRSMTARLVEQAQAFGLKSSGSNKR